MLPLKEAIAEAQTQAEKNLLVASFVSQRFREKGWETVVVGGSALEIYTGGGYVTGDVDLCRAIGTAPIPPNIEAEVMRSAGGVNTGVRRQWSIEGVLVDLLGEVETVQKAPFRTVKGPYGDVRLMPAEEVLVERAFIAFATDPNNPNREALAGARQLVFAGLKGVVRLDWAAVDAIARGREYGNKNQIDDLKNSVASGLQSASKKEP